MSANPSESTGAGAHGSVVRRQPLVAPDLVRRWAARAGVPVTDGPLDDTTVQLYLYWHRGRNLAGDDHEDHRPPAAAPRGVAPPVSPALLEAASFAYRPEPCPACAGPSSITYVDLDRGIQRQECVECGRRWRSLIAQGHSS